MEGGWEAGAKGRGSMCMPMADSLLLYGRNQHNPVKRLYFNKCSLQSGKADPYTTNELSRKPSTCPSVELSGRGSKSQVTLAVFLVLSHSP